MCKLSSVRLSLVFIAFAGHSFSSRAETVTAVGMIRAVDTQSRTISVTRDTSSGQKTGSFRVGQEAKITLNGKPVDFESLAASQKVTLTYDTTLGAITKIESTGADRQWIDLFDGKTLDGWTADKPGIWSVVDGIVVGRGQPNRSSHLFYQKPFTDFELQAQVKITAGNSGLLFRIEQGNPDSGGYEAQIVPNGGKASFFTGSLMIRGGGVPVKVLQSPIRNDVWFTLSVKAVGPRILISVDGRDVAAYVDRRAERRQRGYIALQCYDEDTMVYFRDLKAHPL